jgi:Tfp pilus assembly protein FimV
MSVRFLFFLLPLFIPAPAMSQDAPADTAPQPEATAPAPAPAPEKTDQPAAAPVSGKDWRDVSGYRFPALASTVAAAQNMAQAMILRDYCANAKVPDAFVRARLARFSRITGREENCRSLLDY